MSALANIRHERFARAVIRTGVAARAYLKAGYTPTTRNALDVSACQLLRRPKVQARIKELRKQMAARNRITVDTLLDDLAADRALARELGQPAAAISATMNQARLVGLLVDRKESRKLGDFAELPSEAEVLAMLRAELGEESAAVLAAALERLNDQPGERA
jgi:phage terminase small subunit